MSQRFRLSLKALSEVAVGYGLKGLVLFLAFQSLAQAADPSSALLQVWGFQGRSCIGLLAGIPANRDQWKSSALRTASWKLFPEKKETLKGVLSKDGRLWVVTQNLAQAQAAMGTFLSLVPDPWLALEFLDNSSEEKSQKHDSFATWSDLSSFLFRWQIEKEAWEKDGYIFGHAQNTSPWVLLRSDEKAAPLVLRAIALPGGLVYEISGLKIKERAQIYSRLDPRRYLGALGIPKVETELVAVPPDFPALTNLFTDVEAKPSTIYDLFPNGEKLKYAAQVGEVLGTSVTALVPEKDREYGVHLRDEKEIVIFAKDQGHAVELVGRFFLALPQEQQDYLLKTKSNWTNFVKRSLPNHDYFNNVDLTWIENKRAWPIVDAKGVAISSIVPSRFGKGFLITLTIKEAAASVESIAELVNAPHPRS